MTEEEKHERLVAVTFILWLILLVLGLVMLAVRS